MFLGLMIKQELLKKHTQDKNAENLCVLLGIGLNVRYLEVSSLKGFPFWKRF